MVQFSVGTSGVAWLPELLYVTGMPRCRNTKSTSIYWLVDVRPETIAGGWSGGKPFYCGKTTQPVRKRISSHYADARRHGNRRVGSILRLCGDHLRVVVMEIVPADGDWPAREKFWISQVRLMNPDCANISDGGFGMTGYIATEETRRKMSAALSGKTRTAEQREHIRQLKTGTIHGPEMRRKVSEANQGKVLSEETRQKIRIARTGTKMSIEARAKMSVAKSGKRRPLSEETKRKIGNANRVRASVT